MQKGIFSFHGHEIDKPISKLGINTEIVVDSCRKVRARSEWKASEVVGMWKQRCHWNVLIFLAIPDWFVTERREN